jgi:hypothetical protein
MRNAHPIIVEVSVQIEPDADGFHAVITDAENRVLHVTDSLPTVLDACVAAWTWAQGSR